MQTVINIVLCFGLAFCTVSACMYWYLYLVRLRHGRKGLDHSFWMFCGECNIKWRPTGYGPPAPDDRICPQCNSVINVQQITDNYDRIPKYGERSSNEN